MVKLRQLNEQEMVKNKKRFKKLLEYSFVNQEDDLLLDEDKPENEDIPGQKGDINMNDMDSGDEMQNIPQDNTQNNNLDPNVPDIDTSKDQNLTKTNTDKTEPVQPETTGDLSMNNQEGEIEIDVTDLTDKQSELNNKVEMISNQTQQMMDTLNNLANKVQTIIQNTGTEIDQLKNELIKRNPTPVETLQKRITVSDPFNQTPSDFWNKKEQTSNYRLSDNEDNEEEYVIKPSDIDIGNTQDVYKSFNLDDDEMNQSLSSMFKF